MSKKLNKLLKGSLSYEQMVHKVKHMEKLILDLSEDVIELSKGKVLPRGEKLYE